MDILYSDDRVVVCLKPVGVLSTDEPGGVPSLLREVLGEDGQPVLSVHRLDRPVGGVMVYARTHRAASDLGGQMPDGRFRKEYLAVIHGTPEKEREVYRDVLLRNGEERKTYIVPEGTEGGRPASLESKLLQIRDGLSLVRVRLMTGRTHQIRCQFAGRGLPLFGDRKYGLEDDGDNLALWSYSVGFHHPRTGERMEFLSPPPQVEPWTSFADVLYK